MVVAYFHPVSDLLEDKVGRRLSNTATIPCQFAHYQEQLREDEHLYMVLSGGPIRNPQLAPCVDDEAIYLGFYTRYLIGMYTDIDFFALLTHLAEEPPPAA